MPAADDPATVLLMIRLRCRYCQEPTTDDRDYVFSGMMVTCLKCGKITVVYLEKENERSNRLVGTGRDCAGERDP